MGQACTGFYPVGVEYPRGDTNANRCDPFGVECVRNRTKAGPDPGGVTAIRKTPPCRPDPEGVAAGVPHEG